MEPNAQHKLIELALLDFKLIHPSGKTILLSSIPFSAWQIFKSLNGFLLPSFQFIRFQLTSERTALFVTLKQ